MPGIQKAVNQPWSLSVQDLNRPKAGLAQGAVVPKVVKSTDLAQVQQPSAIHSRMSVSGLLLGEPPGTRQSGLRWPLD